jgi:hypothetical protein
VSDLYDRARELGATHDAALEYEHDQSVALGLLDPEQPTEWAHLQHERAMSAEFTPIERRLIRGVLFPAPSPEERKTGGVL